MRRCEGGWWLPTFTKQAEELRGGKKYRAFQLVYPVRRLKLSTYTYPDGKLEQPLVDPTK